MIFDYLEQYATFNTVAEMDEAVAGHLAAHDLTESERNIVLRIARSALAYPGVVHLKAQTIADSLGISTKTVYRAVKRLVELGVLAVVASTKMNGIKGANIYQILHVPSKMSERVPAEEGANSNGCSGFSGKQTSSFNLFQTSSLTEIDKPMLSRFNDWQKPLYELLIDLPLNDELKDGLRTAILATPIENMRGFTVARDAMLRIIHDIQDGKLLIRTTLRAVYKGAYDNAMARERMPATENPPQQSARPVPFYDWLAVRE